MGSNKIKIAIKMFSETGFSGEKAEQFKVVMCLFYVTEGKSLVEMQLEREKSYK